MQRPLTAVAPRYPQHTHNISTAYPQPAKRKIPSGTSSLLRTNPKQAWRSTTSNSLLANDFNREMGQAAEGG